MPAPSGDIELALDAVAGQPGRNRGRLVVEQWPVGGLFVDRALHDRGVRIGFQRCVMQIAATKRRVDHAPMAVWMLLGKPLAGRDIDQEAGLFFEIGRASCRERV